MNNLLAKDEKRWTKFIKFPLVWYSVNDLVKKKKIDQKADITEILFPIQVFCLQGFLLKYMVYFFSFKYMFVIFEIYPTA